MDKFFSDVQKKQNAASGPSQSSDEDGETQGKKAIAKGVVLGKDGKPCRSCTSFAAWAAMTKKDTAPSTTNPQTLPASTLPSDCPPDVETLGASTWTFLHTLSASYPPTASPGQQSEMKQFLSLFAKLYPCWHCAEDFQQWMGRRGNEPRVRGRGEFGTWMCEAHNEVNRKLGKTEFDCGRWEERWRTGWRDGRCG